MTALHRKSTKLLVAGLLAAILLPMWAMQIDDGPIISDATQSLQMGVNLERHGIFSADAAPPFTPTNFREPLVPVADALGIAIVDAIKGKSPPEAYSSGERLKDLKYQNLFWLALLSAGTYWIARSLTSSFSVGIVAVILVAAHFRPHDPPGLIDDLMTEIPSAAMLVVGSGALALAFSHRKPALFALAGVMFGALALAKAVGLYVLAELVVILAGAYLMQRATYSLRA